MTESTEQVAAEVLADLSAVVREYLMKETDITRPSFHATALATNLASVLAARLDDGLAAKVRELADEWQAALAKPQQGDGKDGSEYDRGIRRGVLTATALAERELRALLDQPHTGTNP